MPSEWKGRDQMASKRKKQYRRLRADTGQKRRIMLCGAVFGLLAFLPLGVRLYDLMVVNYSYYARQALRNQTRTTQLSAARGVIYDRNMNILADSETVETVYLDPHELKQSGADLDEISRVLAELLELDPEWILAQGKDLSKRYKQVAAGVEKEIAGKIREYINGEKISGIHLEPNARRVYPFGTLAAQVIGFTNASGQGAEGIEAAYNSFLEGASGKVITTKGNNEMDMPFSYENFVASENGCDLVLTLDVTVQACLEKQMAAAIDRYAVQNGAFGMVMEVNTGKILAMATLGSYDPNAYLEIMDPKANAQLEQLRQKYIQLPASSAEYADGRSAYQNALQAARLKQWRNRCISDGYEPGSTFKVLTMAAALDCGAIDLDTNFYCRGAEQIPGRAQRLHCWRSTGHGGQKTPQALQNSCNLAFAHIALKIGGERFYEYVKNFGVLEKTGIDLSGESKGVFFDQALVTDTDKWGTASLTSGSFGQTFKLTPLQLVRGISAVVNGGVLMEPYIVSEAIDRSGNTVLLQEPTVVRRVIREETSKVMCSLMESVVTEGTAKNAKVAGFSVGGKTGTSEKIDVFDANGQRVLDKIVSFVGVAPMDDPQYIVLVALDTPSRTTGMYISGGVMAAPTVGAVLADILPYLEVKHNYSQEDLQSRLIPVADLSGMTGKEASGALRQQGLEAVLQGDGDTVTAQLPAAGQSLPGGSQVLVYMGLQPAEQMVRVPDLSGMTRQQASDAAGLLGLYILPKGNTEASPYVTAVAQSPVAGEQVQTGTTVTVTFTDTKTTP